MLVISKKTRNITSLRKLDSWICKLIQINRVVIRDFSLIPKTLVMKDKPF